MHGVDDNDPSTSRCHVGQRPFSPHVVGSDTTEIRGNISIGRGDWTRIVSVLATSHTAGRASAATMADSTGMRLLTLLEELPSSSETTMQDAWEALGTKESYTVQDVVKGLSELQLDVGSNALSSFAEELSEKVDDGEEYRIKRKVAYGMILLLVDASEEEKVEMGYQLLRGEHGVRKDRLIQDMWDVSRVTFFAIKHLSEASTGISDRQGVFSLHSILAEAIGKAIQDIPTDSDFLNAGQFRYTVTSTIYKIVSLAVETVLFPVPSKADSLSAAPIARPPKMGPPLEEGTVQLSDVRKAQTPAPVQNQTHSQVDENATDVLARVNLENPEQVVSDAEVYKKPAEGSSNTKVLWELASDVGLRMFCIGCGKIMFVTAILGADAAICIFLFTSGNLSLAAAIGVGVAINTALGVLAFIISIRYLKQYETPTLMKQAQGLMHALQSLAEQNLQQDTCEGDDEDSTGLVTPQTQEEDVEDGLASTRDKEEITSQNPAIPSPSVAYVPEPRRSPWPKGSRRGRPVRRSWADMLSGALHQKSSK